MSDCYVEIKKRLESATKRPVERAARFCYRCDCLAEGLRVAVEETDWQLPFTSWFQEGLTLLQEHPLGYTAKRDLIRPIRGSVFSEIKEHFGFLIEAFASWAHHAGLHARLSGEEARFWRYLKDEFEQPRNQVRRSAQDLAESFLFVKENKAKLKAGVFTTENLARLLINPYPPREAEPLPPAKQRHNQRTDAYALNAADDALIEVKKSNEDDEESHGYFLDQLEMDLLAALPDCDWRFRRVAKLMIKSVYQATRTPFDMKMTSRRWFRQGVTILAAGPLANLPVSERDYSRCDADVETLGKLTTELVGWRDGYCQRREEMGEEEGELGEFLSAIMELAEFFKDANEETIYNAKVFQDFAASCVDRDFDVRPPDTAIQDMASKMSVCYFPENDMGAYDEDLDRYFKENFDALSYAESRVRSGEDPAIAFKDMAVKALGKLEKHCPVDYFEYDDRYEFVEKRLIPLVHAPPSVFRLIKLSDVLLKGFEIALEHPLDVRLGQQHWLSACLNLMCESPLSAPENDWKYSLTVQDVRAIEETMRNPLFAIVKWEKAVVAENPMYQPEWIGGLVGSVNTALIQPFLKYHRDDDVSKLDLPEHPFSSIDGNGNVVYDNTIFMGILRGCPVEGKLSRYAEHPVLNLEAFEILSFACQGEYDHVAACLNAGTRIQKAIHYLAEIDAKFDRCKDDPIRFSLLKFPATQDPLFTFIAGEFDEPIEFHLKEIDEPRIKKSLLEEVAFVISRMKRLVDLVTTAAKGLPEETLLEKAWLRLIGQFERRSLQGPLPPFCEQEVFHELLCAFRDDFNAAIDSLPDAPQPFALKDGSPSVMELGRRAVEQELPAAARIYAELHPETAIASPSASEIAEAVKVSLSRDLSQITEGVGEIQGGMKKLVRQTKRKGEKNLKLAKTVLKEVRALWKREQREPSHYPEVVGRKVSKADVYGLHKVKLAQKGVMTYDDFCKAIDNGRKQAI